MKVFKIDKDLSKKEYDDFNCLLASFRTSLEIYSKNRIVNLIFILFILGISFTLLIDFLETSPPPVMQSMESIIINLIAFFLIATLFSVLIFNKKFQFHVSQGISKYFTYLSKKHFNDILKITVFVNTLLLIFLIFVTIKRDINVLTNVREFTNVSLFVYFFALFLQYSFPIICNQYINRDSYFKYTKNLVNKLNSPSDKIKAYNSLFLSYKIHIDKYKDVFGKESLSPMKFINIMILALKIMKLNLRERRVKTISDILSDLEKNDPLDKPQKFIGIMNKIEARYSDDSQQLDLREIMKGGIYLNITPAKISLFIVAVSSILGAINHFFNFF